MKDLRVATEPTPGEVARLGPPLPVDAAWTAATAPTEDEVGRMRPRRAAPRAVAWVALVPVVALAAAILGTLSVSPPPVALPVPEGQVLDVVDVQQLDATWSVAGKARIRVMRVAAGGLDVEVDRGTLSFFSTGVRSPLLVRTATTTLTSEDGRFELEVRPDRALLEVLAGVVSIRAPEERVLSAGGRWGWPPPFTTEARAAVPSAFQAPAGRAAARTPPTAVAAPPPPDPAAVAAELLARRDRGDSAAAMAPLVDAWLSTYAGSPLAPEMRWLGLELAVDTTAPTLALGVIDAWTTAHRDDVRRMDAWWLRAEVAETRLHDCTEASVAYRWIIDHGPIQDAAEARRRLAACAPAPPD